MRQALCAVALLAAMIWVPQTVRGGELPTASADQRLPVTTAVYHNADDGANVQQVNWQYGYGYRYPSYGYGYRYPSYGYRYPSYGYRSYYYPRYSYRYPSYGYRYPSYGYGYPSYGYRYGARPGVSFGFRF
jgi:hypothetical protein